MFKNMKLGTKIVSGFAVVLLMTAIISYVGYNGISGIESRIANADDSNRLIKWVKDCRQQEKNFIMRGDKKYVDQVHEITQKIYAQIEETKARFKDVAYINKIENVKTEMQTYAKALDNWVDLYDQQLEVEKKMVEGAREFTSECEAIRVNQKAKLAEQLVDKNTTTQQLEDRLWKADGANRLIKLVLDCRREEKNFQLRGDKKSLENLRKTAKEIYALCDEMNASFKDKLNKDRIAKVKAAARVYEVGFEGWVQSYDKQLLEEEMMVKAGRAIVANCDELRQGQKEKMDSQMATAISIMLIGALIGIILGSIIAFIIVRSITKPLNKAIDGLTAGAEQVGAASEQVAGASQQLAEGASEQASSLEETSSSLEEMAGMTRQNAENGTQANTLANDANNAAGKGAAAMEGMSGAMREIKKSSDETAKIIKVIDEIAFQTNLLALNAAVEAARAGEAGKGFAVVAEEVRNLAQRSAEAAKNTNELIEGSQKNADNGVRAAEELTGIFKDINSSIGKVVNLVAEVSAASAEQGKGIDQINTAVAQMDQVTQQNASGAEESSSASEELAAQAQQMQAIVYELARVVNGSKAMDMKATSSQATARKFKGSTKQTSFQSHGLKDKIHKLAHKSTSNDNWSKKKEMVAAHAESDKDAEKVIPLEETEMKDF